MRVLQTGKGPHGSGNSGDRDRQGGGQQGEGRDSSDTDPPDVWEVFNSSTDSEVEYYSLSSLRRPVTTSPGAPRAPTYPRGTRGSRASTTSRGSQSAPPQGVTDSQASTSQLVVSPASAFGPEVAEDHVLDNPQDVEAPQQSSPHQHRRRVARTPSPPAHVPDHQAGHEARGTGRRRGRAQLRRGRPM